MEKTATKTKTREIKTDVRDSKNIMKEVLYADRSLFQLPHVGDIVEGKVIGKESGVLYLDLGPTGTGVIYGVEYYAVQDIIKNLKPGDAVAAKLIEFENKDGYRELSLKEAGEEKKWREIKEKKQIQELIDVKITDANRGGLIAKYGDIEGFIPVSQLSLQNYPRVEGGDKERILDELKKFIGSTMRVSILDLNSSENKLIFSERAAEGDMIKKALGKYKVGDTVEGEITGIVDFGAFIKFDELLEGLIHISELDWNLVKNPGEVVKIGDKIKAKIMDIAADGRVSLSLKALKKDPWEKIAKKYKVGDVVEGEVTKMSAYGALIKVANGIQGLVHISEFENEEALKAQLQEGKKYKFEIISLEPTEHKMTLKLTVTNK